MTQNFSSAKISTSEICFGQCGPSQSIRMDLNKKSKPKQKTITASKGTP